MVYNLNVNCYVTKPGELAKFMDLIARVEAFWLKNRGADEPKIGERATYSSLRRSGE